MSEPQHAATLVSLYADRVASDADRPAILARRDGKFTARSWAEYAGDVRRMAAALVALGVRPGDRVVHVSWNRYEWAVTDLAIQLARAVHVPIHASLAAPQIVYQIVDSDARLVLLSGPEQAEKLAAESNRIPKGLAFVAYDPCSQPIGDSAVRTLADVLIEIDDGVGEDLERQALAATTPDDLVTILYTSGTTGEPKGVMLSQRNLTSNVLAVIEIFPCEPGDRRLNWLPLSHVFARTCDLYLWIAGGGEMAIADAPEAVLANCAELQPTIVNGVPYFWDKVCRALCEHDANPSAESLKNLMGGRLRLGGSGGAALPDHVNEFFLSRDVVLGQGYGLTETSPVITFSRPDAIKVGTVGRAIPGVDIKIADDGEILTRGPHVMVGYWKRPDATAEAIRDGWFHTGDLGSIDSEGYLLISGRKKELIVTAGGKNIAPVYLEALLTEDPLIAQAMVIGDDRKYLTALIVPDPTALGNAVRERGIRLASPAEALTHADVLALYEERIGQRLAGVSRDEQVRRFTLLSRGFSLEQGEMTPTLKLRREQIGEHFADAIAAMYDDAGCADA